MFQVGLDSGTSVQRFAFEVILTAVAVVLLVLTVLDSAEADEMNVYRLAPGDRITVVVFGQKELSGDFTVDDIGNISFPLIGSINVSGLSIKQCRQLIAEHLEHGVVNTPFVDVRVAEPRSIYVLGDVRNPASYPYRYESIVKSAIAQAGGFGIAGREPGAAAADFLAADERMRVLNATRSMQLIRIARLEAQRSGSRTFSTPVLPPGSHTSIETAIAQEQDMLETQFTGLEKQLALIRSQKPVLFSESQAIESQISSEQKQLELIRDQGTKYKNLMKRGLGINSRFVDLQLNVFNKESSISRLKASLFRVKASIVDLDIRIQELISEHKNRILRELQDARGRLHEAEVTLSSAREIRELRLQQLGGAVGEEVKQQVSITRMLDKGPTTFHASGYMAVRPGDIIEVRTLPNKQSQSKVPWPEMSRHE